MGVDELASRLSAESDDSDLSDEDLLAESDSTLVQLVNKIILDAVEQHASDIHIESNPGHTSTRVRFRKDGTLVTYLDLASRFRKAVVSRVKIMSQLDITEHRKAQDGKIDFSRFGPAPVELRIATIPMRDGLEDVVMRVLAASEPVPINELGFDKATLDSIVRLISRPQGLILVCGPTGSGKTTTLHTLLAVLNTAERKIWTAEDPIEITQSGLRQVQVNPKIGWTFAAAMRSFLRADPDVVMIGEMRDAETTKIAIEGVVDRPPRAVDIAHQQRTGQHRSAARSRYGSVQFRRRIAWRSWRSAWSSGSVRSARFPTKRQHRSSMSLSTSTARAPRSMRRGGWIPGSITSAVRTERSLCPAPAAVNVVTRRATRAEWDCTNCWLPIRRLKRLVQSRAPVPDIREAALAAGMRTLKQDGIDKVLQGLTDMYQVRAACG